jgi:hypothetical protein
MPASLELVIDLLQLRPVYFRRRPHFVPYSGARPVGKEWNTKRRHAQPGRADTLLTDARGRAVVLRCR